jgi:hypothetical protein
MPSLNTSAIFLFGLALLAVSNANPYQLNTNATEADTTMLLTALSDVDAYSSDVSTLVCLYKVNTLETKKNNYNFGVTGCKVDAEWVGRCPDLSSFPGCGAYNIVVSAKKSKKPQVTSIAKQPSK